MKIIKDILSESLFNECIDELNIKKSLDCWRNNYFTWNRDLINNPGCCLASLVSENLRTKLLFELERFLLPYEKCVVQFQLFHPISSLAMHADNNLKFGATLYLNEFWNINDGGLFVWHDKVLNDLKVFAPVKNAFVLNDNQEWHMVTALGVNSPVRSSIQFFAS
jgi:hypothetical protein